MKKKVYREKYNKLEVITELTEKMKPLAKSVVESKKYYKPKIAKKLNKKEDK